MSSLRDRSVLRRRLIVLTKLCDAGNEGIHVAELARELHASTATIYRDLRELEAAGLAISKTTHTGTSRPCLSETMRRPSLRMQGSVRRALQLLQTSLADLEGTFIGEALQTLLRGESEPRGPSLRKAGPSTSAVDAVARALEKRQRLCFWYRGERDQRESERQVEPLELRLNRGQLYLDAWCLEKEGVRTFKPSRMSRVRVLPEPCRRRDVDLNTRRAHSVSIWDGEPVDVTVRIAKAKARFVSEWPLPGMRLEALAQGDVLVRARVAGLTEVTRWILSWGAKAEALEPPELREAVATELRAACGHYVIGEMTTMSGVWRDEGVDARAGDA